MRLKHGRTAQPKEKKETDSLNLGFMKYAFLAAAALILLFSDSKRRIFNSMDYIDWNGVPLSQLPIFDGIANAALILVIVAAYSAAFLWVYYKALGRRPDWSEDVKVVLVFTLVALFMTYPLVFYFMNHVPGDNLDAKIFIWDIWWVDKAVTGLHDPFFTEYIYYPHGSSILFHTASMLSGLMSIPIISALGSVIAAYNMMVLLAIIWSGLAMYKLVGYLSDRKDVALVCGLAFAMLPFRSAHMLGHLNLVSTQWMPFYILHLIKALRGGNWRDGLLAGAFMAATVWTELTLAFFLGMLSAVIVLFHMYQNGRLAWPGGLREVSIAYAVALTVLASPWIYHIAAEYGQYTQRDMTAESIIHSADIYAFITPPSFNPIFGTFTAGIEARWTSFVYEKVVYVGWTIIALAALAFLNVKKLLKKEQGSALNIPLKTAMWAAAGAIFFILSLGPVLHSMGLDVYMEGGRYYLKGGQIDLPFNIISGLPLIGLMRSPSRLTIGLSLALIVLAGYGLERLSRTVKRMDRVLALASVLIVLEFAPIPYPLADMSHEPAYDWLAKEPQGALMELPLGTGSPEFYQTIHGKKTVFGFVARAPTSVEEFQTQLDKDKEALDPVSLAKKYDASYLMIHLKEIQDSDALIGGLNQVFGAPGYIDSEVAVYTVKRP